MNNIPLVFWLIPIASIVAGHYYSYCSRFGFGCSRRIGTSYGRSGCRIHASRIHVKFWRRMG